MNTTVTDTSPYQAPEGELLTEDANQTGEIRFFSASCRIGRLRYLAHGMLIGLAFYAVLGLAGAILFALGDSSIGQIFFWGIAVVAYIGICYISVIVMIQRLHDQDLSGWLSLLMFVPLANLVITVMLLFVPGTQGVNRFGAPPPANKTWHWIAALAVPVLGVLGILAAVAIPAYVDYTERANGYSDDGAMVEMYQDFRKTS